MTDENVVELPPAEQIIERNFDAENKEKYGDQFERKGHLFHLGGYTFTTKPIIPTAALVSEERGLRASVSFMKLALSDDQHDKLTEVVNGTSPVPVSPEEFDAAAMWVVEVTITRPT